MFDYRFQSLTVTVAGSARGNAASAIPYLINSDLQLVVLVQSGSKQAMSVADLVCHVTRTTGITSLNVMEHDMTQKNQA